MNPGSPRSNASSRLASLGMGLGGAPSADTGKRPQQAVNYRPAETPDNACMNCQHFTGPNACELVAGTIDPNGTCDLFEPHGPQGATPSPTPAPVLQGAM